MLKNGNNSLAAFCCIADFGRKKSEERQKTNLQRETNFGNNCLVNLLPLSKATQRSCNAEPSILIAAGSSPPGRIRMAKGAEWSADIMVA